MNAMVLECRIENDRPEMTLTVTTEVLEGAIERLDGDRYNSLVLGPATEGLMPHEIEHSSVLSLSGGTSARYLVSVVEDRPEAIWYLTEPERGDAEWTGIVGGQATPLPGRWWVSRRLASKAARYYLEHLQRDPAFIWELDPGFVQAEDEQGS